MKRMTLFGFLFVIILAILGCSIVPTESTPPATETNSMETTAPAAPTNPVQTTAPPETTVPAEPTLPWEPAESLGLSYEEYFVNIRQYELPKNMNFGPEWNKHSLHYQDGALVVWNDRWEVVHTISDIDTSITWINCDSNWIYGVRNGTELIRMDYWGENEEVLFNDGIHAINVDTGRTYLAEESALFFAACSDKGSIICRVYLPDLTVDILAESNAPLISLSDVLSNHELSWSEDNPAFADLMADLMEDLPEKYKPDGEPIDDLEGWVSKDYKIPQRFCHYVNTLTGERYSMNHYGHYYSDRSSDNIAANGDEWWEDYR